MKAKTAVRLSTILILCFLGYRFFFAKDDIKSKYSESKIITKNISNKDDFNHVKSKDIG